MPQATYADLMEEGAPFIELRINLEQPAALADLVGAFAAVGSQFDEYLHREHPDLEGYARLFVKQIRAGSIIVELVPILQTLVQSMDTVLIVDGFVNRFRGLLIPYLHGVKPPEATKSDVRDILRVVRLIANDTNGSAAVSSAEYHRTRNTERVSIKWDTKQAKQAAETLEQQRIEIDLPAHERFDNVLMVLWQSNRKQPKTGKPTGEKAIIEAISKRPLAIIYESELARERIKYETMQDEKNAFKKGFFVDCLVERFEGRPVAYKISAVRNVIDLPDDE